MKRLALLSTTVLALLIAATVVVYASGGRILITHAHHYQNPYACAPANSPQCILKVLKGSQ